MWSVKRDSLVVGDVKRRGKVEVGRISQESKYQSKTLS